MQLNVHQAEPNIGYAPTQSLHVIDNGELDRLGSSAFDFNLSFALALIPAGFGIAATLGAWQGACPAGNNIFDSKWGYVFSGITIAFLAAGAVFAIHAYRNYRLTKTLIREIRGRQRVPATGHQEQAGTTTPLQPAVRAE